VSRYVCLFGTDRSISIKEPLKARARGLRQSGTHRVEHRFVSASERLAEDFRALCLLLDRSLVSDLFEQGLNKPQREWSRCDVDQAVLNLGEPLSQPSPALFQLTSTLEQLAARLSKRLPRLSERCFCAINIVQACCLGLQCVRAVRSGGCYLGLQICEPGPRSGVSGDRTLPTLQRDEVNRQALEEVQAK
jgi:hypothetical protein